jgi:hypothetical protein
MISFVGNVLISPEISMVDNEGEIMQFYDYETSGSAWQCASEAQLKVMMVYPVPTM